MLSKVYPARWPHPANLIPQTRSGFPLGSLLNLKEWRIYLGSINLLPGKKNKVSLSRESWLKDLCKSTTALSIIAPDWDHSPDDRQYLAYLSNGIYSKTKGTYWLRQWQDWIWTSKTCWAKESRTQRIHAVWFYLYKTIYIIYSGRILCKLTGNICGYPGPGVGGRDGDWWKCAKGNFLGWWKCLIVVVVIEVYVYVCQNWLISVFKMVIFIICKLYRKVD